MLNLCVVMGMFPVTGVTLPFVSYGGTALAVFITMSGVALNVTRYN